MNYFPHISDVSFLDSNSNRSLLSNISFDEDLAYCNGFSPSRKNEFLSGRQLAYSLMNMLEVNPERILIGDKKEPIFPKGFKASISHSKGFIIVCATTEKMEIGIDVENLNRIGANLFPKLFNHKEIDLIRQQGLKPEALFSAKEAFYKMQYPSSQTYLDFLDVELFLIDSTSFGIKYLKDDVLKLNDVKIHFMEFENKVLSLSICPSL